MEDAKVCSVCLRLEPVACELPNGAPLCFDCVVKGTEYGHRTVMEKKRAVVEAKLSVIAEMERAVERMKNDAILELDRLGLAVEVKVELLVRSGNKTRAIMAYREATGKSLRGSKEYVDDLIDRVYR